MTTETTETIETIETIAARIPALVADLSASEAAKEERIAADIALLDRVTALVRPALRAIGTRPLLSREYGDGIDRSTRASWRGVAVLNSPGVSAGPVERCRHSDDTRGTFGGSDLLLGDDGRWYRLRYSGSWSRWQASTSSWESTEITLTTREVVSRYDVDAIISGIGKHVSAAGSRAASTAADRARATRVSAIVALLGVAS